MLTFILSQIVQQAGPHVARHGARQIVRHSSGLFVRHSHWRRIAGGFFNFRF